MLDKRPDALLNVPFSFRWLLACSKHKRKNRAERIVGFSPVVAPMPRNASNASPFFVQFSPYKSVCIHMPLSAGDRINVTQGKDVL